MTIDLSISEYEFLTQAMSDDDRAARDLQTASIVKSVTEKHLQSALNLFRSRCGQSFPVGGWRLRFEDGTPVLQLDPAPQPTSPAASE